MKIVAVTLTLLAAVAASAQSDRGATGIEARIGYGFSSSFHDNGNSKNLSGFELGVALPVGSFLKSDVLLEPSLFTTDGADVYRLTAFLHRTFAHGVGARIGVGYSNSTRNNDIDGQSDVIFDFGVEIPFAFKLVQKIRPYADIHGIVSGENRLNGVFVGVGVRV